MNYWQELKSKGYEWKDGENHARRRQFPRTELRIRPMKAQITLHFRKLHGFIEAPQVMLANTSDYTALRRWEV